MSRRDDLFSRPLQEPGPFIFDARVAAVFPDMVRRSIPGYENVNPSSACQRGLVDLTFAKRGGALELPDHVAVAGVVIGLIPGIRIYRHSLADGLTIHV